MEDNVENVKKEQKKEKKDFWEELAEKLINEELDEEAEKNIFRTQIDQMPELKEALAKKAGLELKRIEGFEIVRTGIFVRDFENLIREAKCELRINYKIILPDFE